MICSLVLDGETICEGKGETKGESRMLLLVYRLLVFDDGMDGCTVVG